MRKTALFMLIMLLTAGCIYGISNHDECGMYAPIPGGDGNTDAQFPDNGVDKLLRFHIIAHSDSPGDQALKLKVRDELIEKIGTIVANMKTKKEVVQFLCSNLGLIEDTARQPIKENNAAYDLKAQVGYFPFPTKTYGSLALPAGNYQALRIVLGDGAGANWWCVMFPPLCFVDTENAIALAKDQEHIEGIMASEEEERVFSADESNRIPVRFRFKTLEFIKKSGSKLAKTLKKCCIE